MGLSGTRIIEVHGPTTCFPPVGTTGGPCLQPEKRIYPYRRGGHAYCVYHSGEDCYSFMYFRLSSSWLNLNSIFHQLQPWMQYCRNLPLDADAGSCSGPLNRLNGDEYQPVSGLFGKRNIIQWLFRGILLQKRPEAMEAVDPEKGFRYSNGNCNREKVRWRSLRGKKRGDQPNKDKNSVIRLFI